MAVYTKVSDSELAAFLKNYAAGAFVSKAPIAEGIENTNYRVSTDCGKFILTLFEKRMRQEDLPFFMTLMAHFAQLKLPVAAPMKNIAGEYIDRLAGKSAALIEFLPGRPAMTPEALHCAALGAMLAKLHDAAGGFSLQRRNPLSVDGWRKLASDCKTRADECAPGLAALIEEELAELSTCWPDGLPQGVVHTDLFPDNVLFEDHQITGVIDFYFAGSDYFAYDIAVCINAWCFDGQQNFVSENAQALMAGYLSARNLSQREKQAFPILLRGAALRFLLTRLYDWQNQIEGAIVTVKDPLDYRAIIKFHREHYAPALYGFPE